MLEYLTERESLWDYLARCGKPVVLYGMGDGALKIMEACSLYHIKISAIFASDEYVRGHSFQGYPVLRLSEVEALYDDFVILLAFAVNYEPMLTRIHQIARRHELLVPDVPVTGGGLFTPDYVHANARQIDQVYHLWEDDRSRQIYADLLNFKVSGKLEYLDRTVSPRRGGFFQNFKAGLSGGLSGHWRL